MLPRSNSQNENQGRGPNPPRTTFKEWFEVLGVFALGYVGWQLFG